MDMIRSSLRGVDTATADAVLTTELACLRCAKSHLANFSWGHGYEKTFIAATHHKDEQIQLSALGLLCESVRTTEPPPPSSLPLLLTFLYLNGATQSPNFRYPIITTVKKLLVRIRDSSYAMRKQYSKSKGPDPHPTVTSYQSFLRSLVSQQFNALHPFSSYQRRHMALSVLHLLSSVFPLSSNDTPPVGHKSSVDEGCLTKETFIGPVFEFPKAVSVNQARRLVYSLRDSYDANRALVLELLACFPLDSHGLKDQPYLNYLNASFYACMCSPKAVDCTTASYLLRLLLRAESTQFNSFLQDRILGAEHHSQNTSDMLENLDDNSPYWVAVSRLLLILQSQLKEAKEDLLAATVQNPLYGVMQSVRAALEEAKEMSYDKEICRVTIAKTIELCSEVATLASPVVCNSSPEGFLPGAQVFFTHV
ncbi:Thyroid adenoma-associated protein homolog [Geodia barretti]|uniref:Thyroid adenoma-associated protein homolog n=1 Tax=Geodia barretti TaxID=519541 RepID=A0AA35XL36_GEOBA|nr:Thyroid adenoma-associated protein homolog [Geodia barretti]